MVIVTQNQYLLASKIHHIVMDELVEYTDVKTVNGRNISLKEISYRIQIVYSPENINSNSNSSTREEHRECYVTIRNAVDAHAVFKNVVEQIREQMPDQLFLDKALERMIANVDITALSDRDRHNKHNEMIQPVGAKHANRKPKKIHKSGKAKRGSKAVLRKSK